VSVEAIGSDDPAVDAEIVQLYDTWLRNVGVEDYTLRLNSIGDRECRPAYLERLEAWLDEHDDVLDEEARDKRRTSPLRVFDVKNPAVLEALEAAPKIGESLCPACEQHFATVRGALDTFGVGYELVPTLVRGLDYYTRTAWEFLGPEEGAQSSLSGGGRYDGLVEEIGGPPTPGVGFGAGIERLVFAVEQAAAEVDEPRTDVFIAVDEGAPHDVITSWLGELRSAGIATDTDYAGRSLKGQMTQAARLGATTVVQVRAEGATLRKRGEADEEVALEDVLARLLP
jgi:histidyl-tRNA synthetase